jgi:hypothetical protein
MRTTGSAIVSSPRRPRHGHLVAVDELLAQHVDVVAGGQRHGLLHLRPAPDLGHADRRAFVRRLDDQRQPEFVGHLADVLVDLLVAAEHAAARRRQHLGAPDALGHDLVHRDGRRHHPGPVYGMPISSSAPWMQPSSPWRPCSAMKQRAKPSRLRSSSGRSAGSNACASKPLRLQRGQHAGARQQRDLAFGRRAAHQHGDLAELSCIAGGQ